MKTTYANVASTIALIVALGTGGAYAAKQLIDSDDIAKKAITSKLIDNNAVTAKDLKDGKGVKGVDVVDGSLAGADLGDGSVAGPDLAGDSVESTKIADRSVAAGDLAAEEATHKIGASGEPAFGDGGEGDCVYSPVPVLPPATFTLEPPGFYKDARGVVHLTGIVLKTTTGAGDGVCDAGADAESIEDETVFVLPPGYRPANTMVFQYETSPPGGITIVGETGGSNGFGSLPPGSVFTGLSGTVVGLDGISFRAAGAGAVAAKAGAMPRGPGPAEGALPAPLGG